MSVLKVKEVQSREEPKNAVVEVGQVRMSHGGTPVLIVDARDSPAHGTDYKPFIAIRLDCFDINKMTGCESAEEVAEDYPTILDAEMTYMEAQ